MHLYGTFKGKFPNNHSQRFKIVFQQITGLLLWASIGSALKSGLFNSQLLLNKSTWNQYTFKQETDKMYFKLITSIYSKPKFHRKFVQNCYASAARSVSRKGKFPKHIKCWIVCIFVCIKSNNYEHCAAQTSSRKMVHNLFKKSELKPASGVEANLRRTLKILSTLWSSSSPS